MPHICLQKEKDISESKSNSSRWNIVLVGGETSTSTSIEPRRLDEEGDIEMGEANSNVTNESPVDDDDEAPADGGFEEEIDLENYPETYGEVDENAEGEGGEEEGEGYEYDDDDGGDEAAYEYENEGSEYEGSRSRADGDHEEYGDEADLINEDAGNRR